MDELRAYYEERLLLDWLTLNDKLVMTMSIPLASGQTVYKAIVVPSPQSNEADAIRWRTESKNIAISEYLPETALMTSYRIVWDQKNTNFAMKLWERKPQMLLV